MGETSRVKQQQEQSAPLNNDGLHEILGRVPYKDLCRFKCVSKPWFALCSDPEILRKSPKTLSGFFYRSIHETPRGESLASYQLHFTNINGSVHPMVDASLSFLPTYHDVEFVDSCNGLLLLKCQKTSSDLAHDYIVCNLAIEKWTLLPDSDDTEVGKEFQELYLGFDPTISSHFRVFMLVQAIEDNYVYYRTTKLGIYSSETGGWTYKQSEWTNNPISILRPQNAFFNGTLHLVTMEFSVVTVDIDGTSWRTISTPRCFIFIGFSQGQLYGGIKGSDHDTQLSIWVLKDCDGKQWDLKHSVTRKDLFGTQRQGQIGNHYVVAAIHPESNLIFLIAELQNDFMSYNMDSGKLEDICSLGDSCVRPYLPYIPCFSEWSPNGH